MYHITSNVTDCVLIFFFFTLGSAESDCSHKRSRNFCDYSRYKIRHRLRNGQVKVSHTELSHSNGQVTVSHTELSCSTSQGTVSQTELSHSNGQVTISLT